MSDSNVKLLLLWYHKSKLFYNCHRASAEYYDRWNKILGFPAILINVFNSTSLFANSQSISQSFILLIAIFSLFSTMLSAAQTYFEFAKLKDQHSKLMIEYSKILFSIEKIIILVKNDHNYNLDENVMNSVLTPVEKLRETYIHFPEKIWNNYNDKYRSKLSELDVNTSDSINIILNSLKTKPEVLLNSSHKNSETITYTNDTTKIKKENSETKEDNETKENDIVIEVK